MNIGNSALNVDSFPSVILIQNYCLFVQDLNILMNYAYTTLENAAMTAFISGVEFTASAAQQTIDNAKLEVLKFLFLYCKDMLYSILVNAINVHQRTVGIGLLLVIWVIFYTEFSKS